MAFTTTRDQRAQRWRIVRTLATATIAVSTFQLLCAAGSMAQVKAPSKNHLKAAPSKSAPASPSEDPNVQPFAIGTDGSVAQQLTNLQIDPADAQAAADAVGKALGQLDAKAASSGRATVQSQGAGQPKRLVSLQLFSAKSLAVELHRGADGSFGYKLAPGATEGDDERVSSLPSTTSAAGPGARTVVAGSVKYRKGQRPTLAASLAPTGASAADPQGTHPGLRGLLDRQRQGRAVRRPHRRRRDPPALRQHRRRQGQAVLSGGSRRSTSPKAGSTSTASGWAARRWPSRSPTPASPRRSAPAATTAAATGSGFHNGIDFEGKIGEPIYAAADGVINHQGWYYNYGRTVKISHADNFETLYAHMSRFATGIGPGSHVHKGDVIGYVGSTGRSTGPHLHFSVIVERPVRRSGAVHLGEGRQQRAERASRWWPTASGSRTCARPPPQPAAAAASATTAASQRQGAEPWSSNPFTSRSSTRSDRPADRP